MIDSSCTWSAKARDHSHNHGKTKNINLSGCFYPERAVYISWYIPTFTIGIPSMDSQHGYLSIE